MLKSNIFTTYQKIKSFENCPTTSKNSLKRKGGHSVLHFETNLSNFTRWESQFISWFINPRYIYNNGIIDPIVTGVFPTQLAMFFFFFNGPHFWPNTINHWAYWHIGKTYHDFSSWDECWDYAQALYIQ